MAYHLLNIETSEYYYCDDQEWVDAINIAQENYWEPDGTTFDPFDQASEQCSEDDDLMYFYLMLIAFGHESAGWSGSYTEKKDQIVIYEDSYYLALCLEGTAVKQELIDFIKKGSFRICSD